MRRQPGEQRDERRVIVISVRDAQAAANTRRAFDLILQAADRRRMAGEPTGVAADDLDDRAAPRSGLDEPISP